METDNWFGFMRSWKNKSTKVFIQNARLLMALEQKYPARQSAAFIERVDQSSKRGQTHLRGWEENSCSYTGPRDVCLSHAELSIPAVGNLQGENSSRHCWKDTNTSHACKENHCYQGVLATATFIIIKLYFEASEAMTLTPEQGALPLFSTRLTPGSRVF